MSDNFQGRTCKKCGWVYFGVSRAYMEEEVRSFNEFYYNSDKEVQDCYGGPSSFDQYLTCWCGNSYKNFRDSEPGDCPDGCTINPILVEEEDESELTRKARK